MMTDVSVCDVHRNSSAALPPTNDSEGVMRTPAAADYLGLAQSTLNKMRLTGDGP
jgi:hypothetical protein